MNAIQCRILVAWMLTTVGVTAYFCLHHPFGAIFWVIGMLVRPSDSFLSAWRRLAQCWRVACIALLVATIVLLIFPFLFSLPWLTRTRPMLEPTLLLPLVTITWFTEWRAFQLAGEPHAARE